MKRYFIFLFLFLIFSNLHALLNDDNQCDLETGLCKKLCELISVKIDPEFGEGFPLEIMQQRVREFIINETSKKPLSILNQDKLRSFLLNNREKLLSAIGIENISKAEFNKIVNSVLNQKTSKKIYNCASKTFKLVIAVFCTFLIVFSIVLSIKFFKELKEVDFGICVENFKKCVSEQLNESVPDLPDFPDLPDLPDIPDLPDLPDIPDVPDLDM